MRVTQVTSSDVVQVTSQAGIQRFSLVILYELLDQRDRAAVQELKGCYAIVVLDQKAGELIAARKESPLVLATGEHETFAAPDAPAGLLYLAVGGHAPVGRHLCKGKGIPSNQQTSGRAA